jgi:hypothetical protein
VQAQERPHLHWAARSGSRATPDIVLLRRACVLSHLLGKRFAHCVDTARVTDGTRLAQVLFVRVQELESLAVRADAVVVVQNCLRCYRARRVCRDLRGTVPLQSLHKSLQPFAPRGRRVL